MFEKIFKPALAAAALSVAGCEKAPDNTGIDEPTAAAVMAESSDGNIEITLPEEGSAEEVVPPQYTPEEVEEILSGTTQEVDGMTREEIDKLEPPQ